MISLASLGDNSPAAQAARTADVALRALPAVSILGNSNSTVRSRRLGTSVLSKARSILASPLSAISTALAPSASACPSISPSRACVTRLREPLGRPLGLPLLPGSNGRPRCFSAVYGDGVSGTLIVFPPIGNIVRRIYHDTTPAYIRLQPSEAMAGTSRFDWSACHAASTRPWLPASSGTRPASMRGGLRPRGTVPRQIKLQEPMIERTAKHR
jgi:hypothetical protein